MSIWRISLICPSCMCSNFEKDEEYGTYICIDCGEEWEDYQLEIMDYQIPLKSKI